MPPQKRANALNRRKWNRLHIPPVQYDLLLHLALFQRISERNLYRYIFLLMLHDHRAQIMALLDATEAASGDRLPDDLREMLSE